MLSRAAVMAAVRGGGLEEYRKIGRGDTDDTSFGKFMHVVAGVRPLQVTSKVKLSMKMMRKCIPTFSQLLCFQSAAVLSLNCCAL